MSDTNNTQHDATDQDPCDGCSVAAAGRRRFLRDAALMVAGTLAALSAGPVPAAALEPRFIRSLSAGDGLKTYPIPATDGVNIDKDASVIIARWQSKLFAFSLACPHQNTPLHWEADNQDFWCPKHHSIYTPDGVFIDGRATRSMDRFSAKRDGGNVLVDLATLYREDDDPDRWKTAFIAL